MTLQVPYMPDDAIERDAEGLLTQYAHARGVEIRAPIPIEDIVEKHQKLRIEFDDLHALLGVPRRGMEPDVFGAIWLETGEIVIDESLDPEERPSIEGRYRFTLAHEGGAHWRLHRPLIQAKCSSLCGETQRPTIVCRSSQTRERVEWQADFYASCLLMPRKLVVKAWRNEFGDCKSITYDQSRSQASSHYRIAERFAPIFGVSTEAMRLRLKKLGLLRHKFQPREARFGEHYF